MSYLKVFSRVVFVLFILTLTRTSAVTAPGLYKSLQRRNKPEISGL